jgi:uncharacterized membrane protein
MAKSTPVNVHGRKWGRGLRPYLLIPKLTMVAGFIGGLVATLILVYRAPAPAGPDEWRRHLDLVHRAFSHVVVPCLIGAMTMGVLLLSCHFAAIIRMRWFQFKLFLVAAGVPCLHVYMYTRMKALIEAVNTDNFSAALALRDDMARGTAAALLFGLLVLTLGRVKPRLGQDYGRTFAHTRGQTANTS